MSGSEPLKRSGILLALVGPTGGGKTSLGQSLLDSFDGISLSVSYTSRAPRRGEVEGEAYHFVDRAQFEQMIAADQLFEWEEVHGNYYGTSRAVVDQALAGGRDLLLDIEVRGASRFKREYPDSALIVFVVPPSRAEMERRVRERDKISDAEIKVRLQTAKDEYAALVAAAQGGGGIDYLIVNTDFESSAGRVRSILLAERCRLGRIGIDEVQRLSAIV